MNKINCTIDGQLAELEAGTTVLQACQSLGIEIPIFCYHEELSIAGNCRMCLVEQANNPKPIASCATPVSEGMVIHTHSPMVKKAREGALEFLLINHPLDCPICDQAGECDLQDITLHYARPESRFFENKRVVEDKDFGPIIKTELTRCIHCTRCVRFSTEVAGVPEMGALGRGENMEISTCIENTLSSEFSGNVIDLCPVGALTFKPYEFKARAWELKSTASIDVSDATGTHIYIDSRDDEIMRILPRTCPKINQEWITDKTRLLYEGLKLQRLDRPYIRVQGTLKAAEWTDALELVAQKIKASKPERMAALVGGLADAESMFALKSLWELLGIPHLDFRLEGGRMQGLSRDWYTFNTPISEFENVDMCLIIGANLRHEAPLINLRLRKAHLKKNAQIFVLGDPLDLTYPYTYLGNELSDLSKLDMTLFHKPAALIGGSILEREDLYAILAQLKENFSLNVLHKDASHVAALDLDLSCGFNTHQIMQASQSDQLDLLYLLGVDDARLTPGPSTFVIYQGHHGEQGAQRADVVFPGLSFAEKAGTYINLEGLLQTTTPAVSAPGCAKEDWKIIRALSGILGHPLSFNTVEQLRAHMHVVMEKKKTQVPTLLPKIPLTSLAKICSFQGDFYQMDVISRHSLTLRKVSKALKEKHHA